MTPAAHRVTTAQLGAAYPFVSEGGFGGRGVLVGRDLLGGSFTYDPFELYARGALTNPNMIVIGQIGRGKSSFVKSYLWRQSLFGRRAWVVDPKGEYADLARAWGVEPVSLRPGGSVRLNPLDTAGDDDRAPDAAGRRRSELLGSLATACLGRPLLPGERTAVDLAVDTAARRRGGRPMTLPDVVDALLEPTDEAARAIRTDTSTLAADGRDVALELRRLVHGDLRGMFDGPTTPGVDLDASLVILDLSAVYGSDALGILMTCASAWLQAALSRRDGQRRIVVVDEAWVILTHLGVARWLQASWKLSRAFGVANVAVLHRLSDLGAAGSAGSEQVGLAQGLLSDSETRVVYGQPPGEVDAAGELLGLTSTEAELLPQLGRGVALWKVGQRSFLVEHHLAPAERALVDTDATMAGLGPR
jgi:type IV secretory pathway VirB4 component